MADYWGWVVFFDFSVNFLLLLGTNRLRQSPQNFGRCVFAAAVGGLHAGLCLLPGFSFLGNSLWRMVSICGMSVVAFGMKRAAVSKGAVFLFLKLALGGIAVNIGNHSHWAVFLGAFGIAALCFLGFENTADGRQIPVVIQKGNVVKKIIALHDTGNTLKDPVTGQAVLVVDGELAWDLAGLTMEQLLSPIETMASASVSGLRLIPFRSVGCSCGMLLAIRADQVWINGSKGGNLVAFAPQTIGSSTTYQALSGGIV